MARERRGFIVTQVCAEIAYTDQTGQQQKITKPATAQASGKSKHNLTDTEKQKRKVDHAKRVIHDTIADPAGVHFPVDSWLEHVKGGPAAYSVTCAGTKS